MRTKLPATPLYFAVAVVTILVTGAALYTRASGQTNRVALAESAKPVTVVSVRTGEYRENRRYIGAVQPWVAARLGPQLVSAYVLTVRVRPGAPVKEGQILATLDCRPSSAGNEARAMQARSLAATERATADETARLAEMVDGGFVSTNELERKRAETDSRRAELRAAKAELAQTSLAVRDCVLRAPFDGEVGERLADPGFFARPGATLVTVVDRATVRITAEVPEDDFDAVAAGTPVKLRSRPTGEEFQSRIARRAPIADPSTRTVHIEVDLPNSDRKLPAETTAELEVAAGKPVSASVIPLPCAVIRNGEATVFVVQDGIAHQRRVRVLGESGGDLYVERSLPPGTLVVSEGRMLLKDGDPVSATVEPAPSACGAATHGNARETPDP